MNITSVFQTFCDEKGHFHSFFQVLQQLQKLFSVLF